MLKPTVTAFVSQAHFLSVLVVSAQPDSVVTVYRQYGKGEVEVQEVKEDVKEVRDVREQSEHDVDLGVVRRSLHLA